MKSKSNDFDFIEFLANDFAKNKNKWWKWFEIFAKKYYLKFIENQEKLLEIITTLGDKIPEKLSDLENEKAQRIHSYWLLVQAIEIDDQKEVSINEEIMKEFKKIRNKKTNQTINYVVQEINEELKGENENDVINLDDLFKLTILFYKENETRESFFINFISNENQEWNLNDFSLANKTNFVNQTL